VELLKVTVIVVAILMICLVLFVVPEKEKIIFSELSQDNSSTIHSDREYPHYLSLRVTGHSKTGGKIISHGGLVTKIPSGLIDVEINDEFYSSTAKIQFIPNPDNSGEITIEYDFD